MNLYMHNVPGRLRVRIPSLKANPLCAKEMEAFLAMIEGVKLATANTVTGSVIVNYDPHKADPQEILDRLQMQGFWAPQAAQTGSERRTEDLALKASRIVGKALMSLFVKKAIEGSPFAALSIIL